MMHERIREFQFTWREFDFLRDIVNRRSGIVIGDDKFEMFYARLSRRIRKLGLRDFKEYCNVIRSESSDREMFELINAITTNLTSFFREKHHFEFLAQQLLPDLIEKNRHIRRLDIWSAGCSTGEEPYSIAICLCEALQDIVDWRVGLLATDIDTSVLARAALAIYPLEQIENLDHTRLQRWFLKGQGSNSGLVRVKSMIKDLVEFHQINLLESWSFARPLDVIFCRNVIIYFDNRNKQRLIDRFADTLKDGGYLFVGHSESLFTLTDRFEMVANTVYRKRA